jgi:uncharacterized membrane protein YqjE
MQRDHDPRDSSIGELFKQLTSDVTLLIRDELELFRVEMTEKTKDIGTKAAIGAGMLSGAAVCGLLALGALTATFILVLAVVIPAWVAALIATVVWGAIAGLLALRGKHRLEDLSAPVPTQTVQTVKEDIEWAKTRANSVRK